MTIFDLFSLLLEHGKKSFPLVAIRLPFIDANRHFWTFRINLDVLDSNLYSLIDSSGYYLIVYPYEDSFCYYVISKDLSQINFVPVLKAPEL